MANYHEEILNFEKECPYCKSNIKINEIDKEMAKLFDCSPSWLMGYDENDGYQEVISALMRSEPDPNVEIAKALELYERYKKAIPQVQDAVEALLKPAQSDP